MAGALGTLFVLAVAGAVVWFFVQNQDLERELTQAKVKALWLKTRLLASERNKRIQMLSDEEAAQLFKDQIIKKQDTE